MAAEHSAVVAVALIAAAVMLLTSSVQSCRATIHELVPETRVGAVSGFIHLLSNISGIIGPIVTGPARRYDPSPGSSPRARPAPAADGRNPSWTGSGAVHLLP